MARLVHKYNRIHVCNSLYTIKHYVHVYYVCNTLTSVIIPNKDISVKDEILQGYISSDVEQLVYNTVE